MLIASIPHYKRTIENIFNRYESLVSLSNTLDLANRMANEILDGLPKEEQIILKKNNLILLNAINKGKYKYELIIDNLFNTIKLINQNKTNIKLKVTNDKIILDYRKYNGKR